MPKLKLWHWLVMAGGLYILWKVLASRTMERSSDSPNLDWASGSGRLKTGLGRIGDIKL